MPENVRALFVIIVLAITFFAFAHRLACANTQLESFTRRRNLWLLLTLVAFLAHNFWLYALITTLSLLYVKKAESNPSALFLFLLFVLPMATMQIPGMGVINFFFELSHARILSLIILLPLFFKLRRQGDYLAFGRTGPDKAIAAFLLLTAILYLREGSITNNLRQMFYLYIDVFIPYFVISRSLKNMQSLRDALFSLAIAIMVLAPLSVFESVKHWLLYSPLNEVLKFEGMSGYLGRDGMLRAVVTAGQAIALGYLMVVGIGLYLYLQSAIQKKIIRRLGLLILFAGLITPLSRGPWVGAVVLFLTFFATGKKPIRKLLSLVLAGFLALAVLQMIPGSEKVVNLLPFIGTTEVGNIEYREKLINNSLIVIQRHPWFGSVDYLKTPEMEAMRQGQDIIDIVNSYIQVALETGLTGLLLFVSFFALTIVGIYRAMRSIQEKDSEVYLLGRALLSTQLAILVMIFTVSSITVIPIVYWSVAALGVAYANMVRKSVT